jgi:hypothetical protein
VSLTVDSSSPVGMPGIATAGSRPLQQAVHVDRARDRLEPVVGDEQDEVVRARARDERSI